MDRSEVTIELNAAILAAQTEFPVIDKSADNPFYKSKYAPYEAILKGIRPFLVKNSLVTEHWPEVEYSEVSATVVIKGQGDAGSVQIELIAKVVCTTRITHATSGQFKEVSMIAYPDRPSMHSVQAAITYLKRNNLILILDIATGDEDDDGNAGVSEDRIADRTRQPRQAQPAVQPARSAPPKQGKELSMPPSYTPEQLAPNPNDLPFNVTTPENVTAPVQQASTVDSNRPMTDVERKRLNLITGKQVDDLKLLLIKKGITPEAVKLWLTMEYSINSIVNIQSSDYQAIFEVVEKHPEIIMNPGAKA